MREHPVKLDPDGLIQVISATPLVSIDLIVRNERGEVLLGRRVNRPARGYWFVPGGKIHKNERLQDALGRIARAELAVEVTAGHLIGVFDHIYDDNFLGHEGVGTHYVVVAYTCKLDRSIRFSPDEQHSELQWWTEEALLASREVHDNTKLYFRPAASNGLRCANA